MLEAEDEQELIDVVQAVAKIRRLGASELPSVGARIGIATTSGGAGVWFADACVARGLLVPELSGPVQELLKEHMPPYGSPGNPVDLTAQLIAGGRVVPALEIMAASGEVDAIALVTSLASAGRLEAYQDALAELVSRCEIPLFVCSYTKPAPSNIDILQEMGMPWYTSATRAARGLAALTCGRPEIDWGQTGPAAYDRTHAGL